MDRKSSRMIAAAALVAAAPAAASAAAAPAVPVATSYADLLQPIPNAEARLAAADREAAQRPVELIPAQYAPAPPYAHHHHHHHHHSRAWYRSHGYMWRNGVWVLRPRHHHHHHHSNYGPR